jgi:hypothetical protein
MLGKTLGHHQITSQLGKGGMGEVLDIGLAKAYAGGQAELNLSTSPTLSKVCADWLEPF